MLRHKYWRPLCFHTKKNHGVHDLKNMTCTEGLQGVAAMTSAHSGMHDVMTLLSSCMLSHLRVNIGPDRKLQYDRQFSPVISH